MNLFKQGNFTTNQSLKEIIYQIGIDHVCVAFAVFWTEACGSWGSCTHALVLWGFVHVKCDMCISDCKCICI